MQKISLNTVLKDNERFYFCNYLFITVCAQFHCLSAQIPRNLTINSPKKWQFPNFFLGGAATLQAPRLVRPMPFASFQSNKFEMIFYKVALIIVYIYLEIFTKTISRLRLGDHKPTFTLAQ